MVKAQLEEHDVSHWKEGRTLKPQGPTLTDLLPPVGLCLMVPQPFRTAPPAEGQVQTHEPVGTFHSHTITGLTRQSL